MNEGSNPSPVAKICSRCSLEKPIGEFNLKVDKVYQPYCRECNSSYGKEWYEKNKARRVRQIQERNVRVKSENQVRLAEFLASNPCSDCGESDIVVLEFDHLSDKTEDICRMMTYSWKRIMEEIGKCEVVCCNCHRRRTSKRAGYWREQLKP